MAIFIGFGAFLFALALTVGFVLLRRRAAAQPKKCGDCAHWDKEAGQQMLRSNPAFAQVMQHVTPNQEFGQKVHATREVTDPEGKTSTQRYVEKILPVYPPFENRWEYFGGCQADGVLIHRTGTCSKFKRRAAA